LTSLVIVSGFIQKYKVLFAIPMNRPRVNYQNSSSKCIIGHLPSVKENVSRATFQSAGMKLFSPLLRHLDRGSCLTILDIRQGLPDDQEVLAGMQAIR
jgi:hypothetical protein